MPRREGIREALPRLDAAAHLFVGQQARLEQQPLGLLVEIDADEHDLLTAVADHLRFKRLEGFSDAAWVGISNEPVVSSEALEQHRVFTSVLSVTYRERR